MSEDAGKSVSRDENDKIDEASGDGQTEENLDALRQALNYNWPEIQSQLIEEGAKADGHERDPYEPYWTTASDGTRTLHFSPDAWWLKRFKREEVLLDLPGIAIMNTADWHTGSARQTFIDAYGLRPGDDCRDCFSEDDILAHTERFPAGQFVAIRISGPGAGHVVGMAVTMRTLRPPTVPILPWREAIGDFHLSAHEADGDWLYGVEVAVNRLYQRRGIGAGLYQVRFDLVKRLNLRGWYAIGMLMGYSKHADKMDAREYGEKVIAGELKDSTVTMQMNRGFRPARVITDYCDEPAAGNAGVLIVWENPDYEQNG